MPYDKKLHFIAGLCITCIAIILCYCSYGIVNLWFGLFFGVLAGLLKEVKDQITYGGFDRLDMYTTWAGSLLGAGLCYLMLQGV